MIRIEVLRSLEDSLYEVEFNFEGTTKKAILDYNSIRADIVYGNIDVRYFFHEETTFNKVQIDEDDEDIYHVYLEEYICTGNNYNAYDIEHKVYKTKKGALNFAYKLAKEYDCNVDLLD